MKENFIRTTNKMIAFILSYLRKCIIQKNRQSTDIHFLRITWV
jgi:hypothetical protein